MFPLDSTTILILLLIASALLSVVATLRTGWGQRVLLWLAALLAPYISVALDPPVGELAGLAYMATAVLSLGVCVGGSVVGLGLRYVPPVYAASLLGIAVVGGTGFELWRQYVPEACLAQPLPVQVAGTTLHVPLAMRARVERDGEHSFFGQPRRKYDTADLCRASHNGATPVVAETLWINPAGHAQRLAEQCASSDAPEWCTSFDESTYQHIERVVLSTDVNRTAPVYYLERPLENVNPTQGGDMSNGWLCLKPDDAPTCWHWEPYSGDLRIMAETRFGPVFKGMPQQDALGMARDANTMVRAILSP